MGLLISQAVWWLPALAIIGIYAMARKYPVDWRFIAAAIGIFAIYSAAVFWLPQVPFFPQLDGSSHNWTGKIAAIAITLVMIAVTLRTSPSVTRRSLGLTLVQEEGSLKPALLATLAMIAFVVSLQAIGGDGKAPSTETLLYQALIPGIDEELLFRGLLFGLVAAALAKSGRPALLAGIAVTIVFALGHSFFWSADGPSFDPVALVYVGVLGSLLMFIRIRTGSLLIPVLAHNLTNVANQLA